MQVQKSTSIIEWFDRLIIRHCSRVSMARRSWRPLGMNYVYHPLNTPARNASIPARSTRNVVSVNVRVSHTQWTLSLVKHKFILTINVIRDITTWNNLSVGLLLSRTKQYTQQKSPTIITSLFATRRDDVNMLYSIVTVMDDTCHTNRIEAQISVCASVHSSTLNTSTNG
jgi:hypothetical protein